MERVVIRQIPNLRYHYVSTQGIVFNGNREAICMMNPDRSFVDFNNDGRTFISRLRIVVSEDAISERTSLQNR